MIKIPFDSCVIVSTLDFSQITQRLASAIYVSSATDRASLDSLETDTSDLKPTQQGYFGQIQGFKFSATRIVGHKSLHLPACLFPTIEGDINSLYHGYEILLDVKLHNLTFALLLGGLGGLLATIAPALDNILGGSKNEQYLTIVEIFPLLYLSVLIHFYVDAWRAKKFFRSLFVKGFALKPLVEREVAQPPAWNSDLQFQDAGNVRSSTELLRQNLPSFPRKAR
ncbi:hypothetical protein [Chamaesiphon sp. VAR_69_metabat_338]|uniref:hypothetical protein n=1 Tax=Chamaesiphon sp. VAR_69_metabat_338 TaxID=2964704 RepID=UPI00286D8FDC|nr:hypothetical protein [Chamaesiphon sp. VAR_69_metabat_338]